MDDVPNFKIQFEGFDPNLFPLTTPKIIRVRMLINTQLNCKIWFVKVPLLYFFRYYLSCSV